ncbi:MAG: HAMP domain-containing protein [Planctomycetes bacterium]|nr:HAMP domain-containing protein [Planctomycetota bacterium]
MQLRLRLTLAALSVVTVMGVVGVVSWRINRGIQGDVESLARTAELAVDPRATVGLALEIEGALAQNGRFVAEKLERLPATRRPKLRGALAALDHDGRTLHVLGQRVAVDSTTEFDFAGGDDPLAALQTGSRVEVSCRVEADGTWTARKVETRSIKRDDKVKGTVTAVREAASGWELEISGLVIAADRDTGIETPRGPLYRMENAMRMSLATQECLAAAHELLTERFRANERAAGDPTARKRRIEDLEDRVFDAYGLFAESLDESRESARSETRESGSAFASRSETEWLAPLSARESAFAGHVREFVALAATDAPAAERLLDESLEPFLRTEIQPRAIAYHKHTEETLSSELEAISARSDEAARLELWTNAAGLVLALALGLVVSRSIARPLGALTDAAERIGKGELATRVDATSSDEIGILGRAFNRMAEALAASTVSLDQLSSVLDSMAGALLVLGPDGRVVRANPAAAELVGRSPEELVGLSLVTLSPDAPERDGDALETMARGSVVSMERRFVRRDSSVVPVAFSGAALRDANGRARGFVCLAQDLSSQKRLEADLRRSLAEKEVLLREVHHRVKNNLQVVSSLLALQEHDVTDSKALERFQESQDRIHALVFVHDLLYSSRDVAKIDLAPYLELLAARLKESYALGNSRVALEVDVDDIELDIDRAQVCGLIVNELVTNAFKHAFANRESGRVRIACRRDARGDDESVVLEVADDGRGFGHETEAPRSIGLELVETLVAQLGGRVHADGRRGARYRIEFPIRVALHAA